MTPNSQNLISLLGLLNFILLLAMPTPTFVMAGVQKAASSSIWIYLKQHPQVFLPKVKELEFLTDRPDRVRPTSKEEAYKFDEQAYRDMFNGVKDEIAIGDGTVNCLFNHEFSIPRIKKYLDNPKIFAVLRHPVERAFSDYLMHIRDSIGSRETLPLTKQPPSSFQLRKGLYYEQVKAFKDAFGSNFKVYLYEDIRSDSLALMRDVYEFINVDSEFQPDTSMRSQTAYVPKNKLLNRLLRKRNPLKSVAQATLKLILSDENRSKLRQSLLALNSQDKNSIRLTPEERHILLEYYRDDVLALQDLLERDLSAWLK